MIHTREAPPLCEYSIETAQSRENNVHYNSLHVTRSTINALHATHSSAGAREFKVGGPKFFY